MVKLTKEFIESEIKAPSSGQRFYRDEDVPGFAVRVTLKSKSYILEKRIAGKNRRITIGRCNAMSLDVAKTQAYIMLGDIAKGIDPKTGKRINVLSDVTLQEVLQKFLEVKNNRNDTQRNYRYLICGHLEDWLDMPITSITKDMVEQRHRELTDSPTSRGTPGHGRANNVMKCLRALINFASDRFGIEDEPLIKSNAVGRLSTNGAWHRIRPRQGIIPERKLKGWYLAVSALKYEVSRDFMIFLLLTGMRVGETKRLQWSYIDFENKILTVPRELTKSDREHRLPLSDFLLALLKKRRVYRKTSIWVFQSTRDHNKHLSGHTGIVRRVNLISGIKFACHDLRRTFLTMGEKLDVPYYTLKRLVNHSVSNDITGSYLVLDIERLRFHMSRITSEFLDLLGLNDKKVISITEVEPMNVIQLRMEFKDFKNL
jgi:integrase